MLKNKIDESSKIIENLSGKILVEKQKFRENKAKIIHKKLCEINDSSLLYEEMKEMNKSLRLENSQILFYRNKATLDYLKDSDPKLFFLIKKFQAAQDANFGYKKELVRVENERKSILNEYNQLTHSLFVEDKLKNRIKELENLCKTKNSNISILRDKLTLLKHKLMPSFNETEEVSDLISLYEELLKEKIEVSDKNQRLMIKLEEVHSEIQNFTLSPRKNSSFQLKEDIKTTEKQISKKILEINSLQKIFQTAQTSYKTLKAQKNTLKIKNPEFCETERNCIVKNIGKKIKESQGSEVVKVIKSLSKPRTPKTTKIVQLNRSQVFSKKL